MNTYHSSAQFNQLIITLDTLDNSRVLQAFGTPDKNVSMETFELHLFSCRVCQVE